MFAIQFFSLWGSGNFVLPFLPSIKKKLKRRTKVPEKKETFRKKKSSFLDLVDFDIIKIQDF
jgi:hypothetical protein